MNKQILFPVGVGGVLSYAVWQMTGGNLMGITHIGFMLLIVGACFGYAAGKSGF